MSLEFVHFFSVAAFVFLPFCLSSQIDLVEGPFVLSFLLSYRLSCTNRSLLPAVFSLPPRNWLSKPWSNNAFTSFLISSPLAVIVKENIITNEKHIYTSTRSELTRKGHQGNTPKQYQRNA